MTRELIESRKRAITKHLFLLCPNNSGSTYLSRALATSQAVWSLPQEGQHMIGFAGPSTTETPWPLIWGAKEEWAAHFRDSPDYDWDRTRRAWYYHAAAAREDAPVFHTKSPPFLLIADQLEKHFLNAFFLIMVRDPYATLEGIMRRFRAVPDDNQFEPLARIGAQHLVTCFKHQRENMTNLADRSVFFRYEDLCANPEDIARQITELVPELTDIDLTQKLAVKGDYNEPLRNMNEDQIARLSDHDIALANEVFQANVDALSYFNYAIRSA